MSAAKPPIRIDRVAPDRREPGSILFTTRPGSIRNQKAQSGWVLALDRQGGFALDITSAAATQDVRWNATTGTIFYSQAGAGRLIEIDRNGRELRCWHARGRWQDKQPPAGSIELPIEVLHHTFTFMPNGNFLVLSAEARDYPDWYTSTTDPHAPRAPARLVGDVVTELTPEGRLVHEWRILDMLDPYRITHGSMSDYWQKQGFPGAYDWSHCNAVAYSAEDDSLIVSLRHQDCIVKFDYATGRLRWILGNHGNWKDAFKPYLLTPEAGTEWQYHQHDCSFTGGGRILCFDNGNFRVPAFSTPMDDTENYSRVVEFEVDEAARSVRQVWCYGGPGPDRIFACYQGGALRLPETGNTFMTFGGICFKDGRPTRENGSGAFGRARLIEATQSGDVVLDLHIDDSASAKRAPYSAFRADLMPA
ncbi:MAG: Arylsulfate sulfotransferase AssT precursor [Pseudomonadota bacterium]|jgi:hypothetical protein